MFSFGRVGTPYKGQQCGTRMGSNDTDRYRTLPHNAWFKLLHRWDPALSDNNSIGGLRTFYMQTRLSKIFLYANATLKPISEDAGTFLWSRSYLKYSYWFLSSHHLEKKGTISDISEISSGNLSCHFPIPLVVCPKREGSWWQGRVYGEDGALNPASNNHYQLGTGSLISGKK